MMHNSLYATYFLLDAAQRTILLMDYQLPVTLFVQRNVLDTKLIPMTTVSVEESIKPNMKYKGFYTLKKGEVHLLEDAEVSDITRQKIARAKLLAAGYGYLLWYANMATEAYWSTSSIDYSDVDLLQAGQREALTALFATAKNIPLEEAIKQIMFDEQSLYTLALRRKEILWKYEETLLLVTTQEDLQAWKALVLNDTINVGAV